MPLRPRGSCPNVFGLDVFPLWAFYFLPFQISTSIRCFFPFGDCNIPRLFTFFMAKKLRRVHIRVFSVNVIHFHRKARPTINDRLLPRQNEPYNLAFIGAPLEIRTPDSPP